MNENITKIRERLVALSTDPIETRKLLDQLTEEEIGQANAESPFHVGKKDIVETKDFDHYVVHRLTDGYLLHYRGGYSVKVDDKFLSPASALQQIIDGVPEDVKNEQQRQDIQTMLNAAEMVFRLPMFVFSNGDVTLTAAEVGLKYLLYLQEVGEVPTPETENPEFDKVLVQMNELMEGLAEGLEKQGKEYEKRMGYGQGEIKNEGEGKGESEA